MDLLRAGHVVAIVFSSSFREGGVGGPRGLFGGVYEFLHSGIYHMEKPKTEEGRTLHTCRLGTGPELCLELGFEWRQIRS